MVEWLYTERKEETESSVNCWDWNWSAVD